MLKMSLWVAVFPSLLFCASSNSSLFEETPPTEINACIERSDIKSSYSPELLFKSSALCINDEKYNQAVDLYLVATAYGYFDTQRVLDKTAWQALDVIKTENFSAIDANKRNKFAEALRTRLDDMKTTCTFLQKLGKPNYHPNYMIQAGVQSFASKSKNGLVPNYNPNALWEETRFTFLRCQ